MLRSIKHPDIPAVAGYLLVVLAVFGSALVPPQGQMIFGDDIHRQYYFYRQFFNEWVGKGIFPWWNPFLFGGEPFISNPVVNIWYPPNWLFSMLPLNMAYSWHLAVHVFWAMLGMRMLTKNWVSGVLFGLSGFFMARTFAGHADVIAAASWMPWVIWAFLDAMSRLEKKVLVRAAFIFAFQLLSGYQTMAFFTVIAVGIIAIVRSVVAKSTTPVVRAVFAGAGGVGLAAFHLIPVAEFFRQSIRTYAFPYAWHSYGALEWRSLLQFINPFQFGNQYTYTGPPPNFIEHSAFIGIGGLVAAIIGIGVVMRKKLWFGIALTVVVFSGLWVSLGQNATPDLQYILWKIIPMYHNLRIPPRHLILVVFGLSGLAGVGLDTLTKSFKFPRLITSLITIGILSEMVWFARGFIEFRPIPETRHDEGLIATLKEDREPYRTLQNFGVWLPQRDVLDFDSTMSYGIHSATGYDPSILRPYYDYFATSLGMTGADLVTKQDVQVPYLTPSAGEAIDRLNIKYIMVPPDYDPFSGNARYTLLRDDHADRYRLYENTTVLPRFYLTDRSCGRPAVSRYTPNAIELSVTTGCDTTIHSSEVWYPGWDAYVDGKKVHMDKENNLFRTIFVSSGKHTVVFRYSPRIYVIGGMISVSVLLMLLWYVRRTPTGARRASIL